MGKIIVRQIFAIQTEVMAISIFCQMQWDIVEIPEYRPQK